jgi:protein-disulfide isomerase
MNWLLIVLGAIVVFGIGRWMGESERISRIEEHQQQISDQLAAMGGGAAPGAPARGAAPAPPVPSGLKTGIDLSVEGAASMGKADAGVTLIEFSDFQCPFCGRYVRDTLPEIKKTYVDTGKIRYVFRHYPIDSLHPQAVGSARTAVCAQAQGKFWPMHDRLFANPQDQSPDRLSEHATAVGLNMGAYKSCIAGSAANVVTTDIAAAVAGNAMGTPAFFIGTNQPGGAVRVVTTVYGAKPFAEFQTAIEQVLAGR